MTTFDALAKFDIGNVPMPARHLTVWNTLTTARQSGESTTPGGTP